MSTITMRTATKSTPKARISVALDFEKKQALQELAKQQNRSVHFVMLDIIDKALQEAQEQAQYQEYIKNRVMRAYNEMIENGSQGVTSSEAKEIVMQKVRERLANNK